MLPVVVFEKLFSKAKHEGLNTIHKISAHILCTEITDAELLTKAWNPGYKFENLQELHMYFRKRKEPQFFIDSSKRQDSVSPIYDRYSGYSI